MNEEGGNPKQGLERLHAFWKYVFQHQDPEEKAPPPPAELIEWGQNTIFTAFAGALIGSLRQIKQERRHGPPPPPSKAVMPAPQARALAEEQTRRLVRIANEATVASFRFGSLAAVFYGTELTLGIYRGHRDYYNTTVGGIAAGMLFSLSLPFQSGRNLRSIILSAAMGGCLGLPLGILQERVLDLLPEEQRLERAKRISHTEQIIAGVSYPHKTPTIMIDPAGAVIRQLESSLDSSPLRKIDNEEANTCTQESLSQPQSWSMLIPRRWLSRGKQREKEDRQ